MSLPADCTSEATLSSILKVEFREGIYQLFDLQVLLNLLNDIPVRSQGIVQGEGTTNFCH